MIAFQKPQNGMPESLILPGKWASNLGTIA